MVGPSVLGPTVDGHIRNQVIAGRMQLDFHRGLPSADHEKSNVSGDECAQQIDKVRVHAADRLEASTALRSVSRLVRLADPPVSEARTPGRVCRLRLTKQIVGR
jgi:hypothetical protein